MFLGNLIVSLFFYYLIFFCKGCEAIIHNCINLNYSSYSSIWLSKHYRLMFLSLDPAIKGTLNVLTSCKKFPSVKRVILTSSLAAVLFTGKPWTPEVVVDDSWFSDPEFCQESVMVCLSSVKHEVDHQANVFVFLVVALLGCYTSILIYNTTYLA